MRLAIIKSVALMIKIVYSDFKIDKIKHCVKQVEESR